MRKQVSGTLRALDLQTAAHRQGVVHAVLAKGARKLHLAVSVHASKVVSSPELQAEAHGTQPTRRHPWKSTGNGISGHVALCVTPEAALKALKGRD